MVFRFGERCYYQNYLWDQMPRYVGGIPVSTCQTNIHLHLSQLHRTGRCQIHPNMIYISHTLFDIGELQMLSVLIMIVMSVCQHMTKQIIQSPQKTARARHFCMSLSRGHHLPLRGFVPTSGRLHLQSSIVCHRCTSVLVAM